MRIFLLFLLFLYPLLSNCQVESKLTKVSDHTHFVKKETEIILITQDTLLMKKIVDSKISCEHFKCYDSKLGTSTMFWFDKSQELMVLDFIRVNQLLVIESD